MAYLFDSNIFLRLAEKNSPQRKAILDAFANSAPITRSFITRLKLLQNFGLYVHAQRQSEAG